MKRQRNSTGIQQEKKHDKCWPNQTKEEEVGSIPEEEFRIMIVKMIQNLETKMKLQINSLEKRIEKMQEMFKEDLEESQFSSVQLLFATPWIAACQAFLSITISQSSLKLTSIKLMMPSSHLILCCPLPLLPPIPPSIRVFSNESILRMRWPEYWSFSFSIIPSKEIPGLISFRMDWLDLLAVQGTLKNLLQYHSSKASVLQCSAFFTVQLP